MKKVFVAVMIAALSFVGNASAMYDWGGGGSVCGYHEPQQSWTDFSGQVLWCNSFVANYNDRPDTWYVSDHDETPTN